MTICAGFSFGRAYSVGEMGVKCLTAVPWCRDWRLLNVKALPIEVDRTQDQRTGRTDRRNTMVFIGPVHADHIDVFAHNLWVVRTVLPGVTAFIVQALGFHIGFLRQVTAKTRSDPRAVTGKTRHLFVRVGEAGFFNVAAAPRLVVTLNGLGKACLL